MNIQVGDYLIFKDKMSFYNSFSYSIKNKTYVTFFGKDVYKNICVNNIIGDRDSTNTIEILFENIPNMVKVEKLDALYASSHLGIYSFEYNGNTFYDTFSLSDNVIQKDIEIDMKYRRIRNINKLLDI